MPSLGGILWFCCCPCMCCLATTIRCCCSRCAVDSDFESRTKADFERRQRLAPRPLAASRKHNLTIREGKRTSSLPRGVSSTKTPPVSRTNSIVSTTSKKSSPAIDPNILPQHESRLLNLPYELRAAIYTATLADRVLHILLKPGKLGYIECSSEDTWADPTFPSTTIHPQRCLGDLDRSGIWDFHSHSTTIDGHILPLLQTCRQIYTEAIPLLYSRNTFDFRDLDALRHLSATILPARFNAITSLSLSITFTWPAFELISKRLIGTVLFPPNDEATWEDTWRILAAMKNLRKLRVEVDYYGDIGSSTREARLLAPLWKVTNVRNFTVALSWDGGEWPGSPFVLERPAGVGLFGGDGLSEESD